MVTDIHNIHIHDADQQHSEHSVLQNQSIPVSQSAADNHNHHCGVCSYDHGGHMGKTIATFSSVSENIPAQSILTSHLQSDFWNSRNTSPKLRPPII